MANDTQVKNRLNSKRTASDIKDQEKKETNLNTEKQRPSGKVSKKKSQNTKGKSQKKLKPVHKVKDADENQSKQTNRESVNQKSAEQQGNPQKREGNGGSRSEFQSSNGNQPGQRTNGHPDKASNQNGHQKTAADHKGANDKKQRGSAENKDYDHNNEHEVNHKEQSGKFETAFNRIHKALREMVKETESDAFVELLYSGYKNHSLIRKYKSELHQFAKLRNAIVHERVNADYYIAEPHIEVVERIEEICREFEKPQTALSIATSPVFYYYEDAYLKDVLKVINKFDFTRFPVYDKEDKYIALLTSTEIIKWMAKYFSSEVIHFEDVRIKDLLRKGKNYFVTFVKEDASLYEIEELFERYHTRGKKLQAVIITETGDRHGKPIGVITPWDLLDSETAED